MSGAAEAVRHWLVGAARHVGEGGAFEEALVERLRAAGLPLARFTTGVPSLHPRVDSFSTLWERDRGVTFREYRRTAEAIGSFENSPLRIAYEEGRAVRCPLEEPAEEGEFGILADLRAQGLTDYFVVPLPFSDGSNKAVTYATDRSGGFTDTEIALLEAIRDALAVEMEARYLRRLAATLMDTYVGPMAGRRVLDGRIDRGAVESLRAAIWFSDLRGFTSLSEILPGRQIVDLLNDYFEMVGDALAAEGGEILKFIGDAVLAVFVPGEAEPGEEAETHTARRALAAALAAETEVGVRNEARRAAGRPEIRFGIGLHFGEVWYGNVGSADRLDFTVTGSAVNLASRISGLSGTLACPILVSAEFAALHGGRFDPLGEFNLTGVGEARAVYAPADPAPETA